MRRKSKWEHKAGLKKPSNANRKKDRQLAIRKKEAELKKKQGFAEGEAKANKKFATRAQKIMKFLQSKGVSNELLTAAFAIK